MRSGAVPRATYSAASRTMGTAIKPAARFDPVTDNSTSAMGASGSQSMDCTFKAVVDMQISVHNNFKALVVFVAANFTFSHLFSQPVMRVQNGVKS